MRRIRTASVSALVVAAALAATAVLAGPASAASPTAVSAADAAGIKPPIVKKYIRFGATRKAQTAKYNKKRYHQNTWVLSNPHAIVLHHTAGADWQSAWNTFDGNSGYLGEKPGVSAQFIVHKDGTIYQCMPLTYRGRHCVGMNWTSFGIEFVQEMRSGKDGHWMDRQILDRDKQIRAGLRLVRYLQARFHIKTKDVVGHATANGSRFFRDFTGQKNAAGDWFSAEVKAFRARL